MTDDRDHTTDRELPEGGADLPPGSRPRLYDFARWTVGRILALTVRLRAHGIDRIPASGPVVLVANHSSLLEAPIIGTVLRRRAVFLTKQELFVGPLGWLLRRIGQIPVRRGVPDRTPLLTAVRVLRAGGLIAVFPEGTRGSGDVDEARSGAAWLARSTGAVVLPVACRGSRREAGARRRFRPKVDVLVGTPFPLPALRGKAGLAEATELVRTELAALVTELDRLRHGAPEHTERGVREGKWNARE
jgi:1-acyl-sn-glycerol-3-phosphate acyltransferase